MHHEYEGFPDDLAFHEMMHLFHEMTFPERMRRMFKGLKASRDSGEYKFAKLQLTRLSAPAAGVLLPVCLLLLLVTFISSASIPERERATTIIERDKLPQLDPRQEPPPEPQKPIYEPVNVKFTSNVSVNDPTTPDEALRLSPVNMAAVARIRSPVKMVGIPGGKNPGTRKRALGDKGGTPEGEYAVMLALRWLKENQNADGSWPRSQTAMTGLALLTFLGHGETTDEVECPEFAGTVRKAIDWLVDNQLPNGLFKVKDGHNYSHPIAAYALCEAYASIRTPKVRDAAARAIVHLIEGQHPGGGWDYNMKQSARDDTSYMGWCAQAVKAAKMAGLRVEGLDAALENAVNGFRRNASPDGGFGYTSPARSGLTGVGVLCMQLLGQSDDADVKAGLLFLKEAQLSWDNWDDQPYGGKSPLYYWYYITQAKFHAGGAAWDSWNDHFNAELVRQQELVKGGYVDHEGTVHDIGYWRSPSEAEHSDGIVMDTCLCALQLEIYYRHLMGYRDLKISEEPDFPEANEAEIKVTVEFDSVNNA